MNEIVPYQKPARMVPLIKDQWVRKLKSNKYVKAHRFYKLDYNCYCSVGLLLDVLNPTGWSYRNDNRLWSHETGVYRGDFFEKTGLTWDDFSKITSMNDYSTMTLPEIGQWVEENL